MAQAFGCARVVFNDALRAREDARRTGAALPTAGELSKKLITEAKRAVEQAWPGIHSLWIQRGHQRRHPVPAPPRVATGSRWRRGCAAPEIRARPPGVENGQVRCPVGALSRSMRPDARGLVTFRFQVRDCRPCSIRDQCTKALDPDRGRSITIHPESVHQARIDAHRAQQDEDWAKVYRLRAGVEGTISQAFRRPNLRHSRYRGLDKAHVQNALNGMALTAPRPPTDPPPATLPRPRPHKPARRSLITTSPTESEKSNFAMALPHGRTDRGSPSQHRTMGNLDPPAWNSSRPHPGRRRGRAGTAHTATERASVEPRLLRRRTGIRATVHEEPRPGLDQTPFCR
ncbi:transposase [Streptomyces mirabilis]|uniref:transposase n=1 Tax=Streptomyces mirabilis TaxID=68239 RepID=UPI00368F5814